MNTSSSNQGFIRSHQGHFSTLYRFVDVTLIALCFALVCSAVGITPSTPHLLAALFSALCFSFVAESMELYRSWRLGTLRDMLFTTSSSWGVTATLLLTCFYYFELETLVPKMVFFSWCFSAWALLCGWRIVYRKVLYYMRRRGYNSRVAAVVGLTDEGFELAQEIKANEKLGIRFMGFFDDREKSRFSESRQRLLRGNVENAIELAKSNKIDLLYIAMPLKAEKRIQQLLARCGDTTCDVHIIPNLFIFRMLQSRWHQVGGIHTLSVFDSPMNGASAWLKRMEDLVLGSLILLLISIPMLIIAVGVKMSSKGPVLFKQHRYGIDGRKINVWKFRSMTVMDNGSAVKQATKNDARITPFGAFLRKTSLDELPQFINVLQGSMSIVGPRPHAVAHNEEYRSLISGYMLRHKVKPGITGWAQINGWRGETDTLDKMAKRIEFDLAYIRNWSLLLDLKIVFKTIFKGFTGSNAY